MNTATHSRLFSQLRFRAVLSMRWLGDKASSAAFGSAEHASAIQRIYVINLDRTPDRWRQMSRELRRLRDRSGRPLTAIARRFSAIDARYHREIPDSNLIDPRYSLADQLFVQPEPRLVESIDAQTRVIEMTPQEVAVALSHIHVWKLIAESDNPYTMVLEDDVFFRRGFARTLDHVWEELMQRPGHGAPFDMVYLSYKEADEEVPRDPFSDVMFRPVTGLWQLSGYVLSKNGAAKLLGLLPVRGPIDLWLNHKFKHLDVFATWKSVIEQRPDLPSTNSYSVLPVLSEVGVITRERPLLADGAAMTGPVFAFGKAGTGVTALAMALSMLGYRCCNDVSELPGSESAALFGKKRGRVFNAYVNVGILEPYKLIELAKLYPQARFIMTVANEHQIVGPTRQTLDRIPGATTLHSDEGCPPAFSALLCEEFSERTLILPAQHRDKWELLSSFLGCDYPAHAYPDCEDQPQRVLSLGTDCSRRDPRPAVRRLKSDSSPWIVPRRDWYGLPFAEHGQDTRGYLSGGGLFDTSGQIDSALWLLRNDTFPSNLALFTPSNFTISTDNVAQLTLRKEDTPVRQFTSASIASRKCYLYGRFLVEAKPANVPGVITGIFLHRNAPRQEIDLEFIGKDTTKLLANVYFNPGVEGTKLEYGYRGTPALIDLGFDAAADFHQYEIEWHTDFIRWRVDGRLVHERVMWEPTPIPHLPLQFNVNVWNSRSKELAGKLVAGDLPARSYIRNVCLQSPSHI